MREVPTILAASSLIDRLIEVSNDGLGGIAAMVLGGIFVSLWMSRVFRRRHRSWPFLALGLLLSLGGYAAYDWWYLKLNLSMRDPQRLREDCERLLEHYRSGPEYAHGSAMSLLRQDIPEPFRRIGATWIRVERDHVLISVAPLSTFGGMAGFLYDPKGTFAPREPKARRPTWYRDFYSFHVPGE